MELILWLLVVQGLMGVFDLVYHHEMTEKLTWKPEAAHEMWLHGLRNGLYSVAFLSFGFFEWHGVLAWIFAFILLAEVTITLCDFVIEDRTRKLPATERVTHTLLALNYGAVLGLFINEFARWAQAPTGFQPVYYGLLSWVMGVYALGVLIWFFRDYLRSLRLMKMAAAIKPVMTDDAVKGRKILVTGGTGFIGTALCKSLVASGARITVLTRDIGKAAGKFGGRVELIDSLDRLGIEEAFDIVINLAGEPIAQRWSERAKGRIIASRHETTRDIVSYIQRMTKKPEVFISGSAIGWYGIDESVVFDERSTVCGDPRGTFAKNLCREWEDIAMQAEHIGVRTVVLRTGVVLEKDGGTMSELLFPFDFLIGGPLGHGRQWFSWIHRDDLIGLIYHIINTPALTGAVNGTAPAPVTNADFAKAMGQGMKRPSFLSLPSFVLRMLFGDMADEIMLNGQKVIPEKARTTGYVFKYPDIKSAMAAIFTV